MDALECQTKGDVLVPQGQRYGWGEPLAELCLGRLIVKVCSLG